MRYHRRELLGGAAVAAACSLVRPGALLAAQGSERVFTPEMFGAKGDGRTNDGKALAAMAEAVNANRGGIVEFRRATYLVGRQMRILYPKASYGYDPDPLLEFTGCTRPLIIRGNGARIKCADGLRYGVFDPVTGAAVKTAMPYIGPGLATPYRFMLKVENCSGPVEIADLELDGSVDRLRIGGQYGDTGWQIPAIGLALVGNLGSELVRGVHSHHHAMDGLYIDGHEGALPARAIRRISAVRSEYNGRQGCSIVSGRGYAFDRCSFNHTGRAAVSSSPAAGLDIEAEKKNRDFAFTDCEFVNNVGAGMVADTGDSEGAEFVRCRFVGTTSWSAWPNKPRFRFRDCSFVGALTRAYGDTRPERAAQFHGCTFRDDPALSFGGKVYGGTNSDRPLADLSDAQNVLFSRCSFLATHNSVLPWSTGAIYADCTMKQAKRTHGFPRGKFVGRNVIDGLVDLYGSRIPGEVIINGRRFSDSKP